MRHYISFVVAALLCFSVQIEPVEGVPPMRPLPECWFEGEIKSIKLRPKYRHPCLGALGKLFLTCPHGPDLELPERYEIALDIRDLFYHAGDTRFESCEGLYPKGVQYLSLMEPSLLRETDKLDTGTWLIGLLRPPAPSSRWISSYAVNPPEAVGRNMLAAIRRAEESLALLREKKWDKAVEYVAAEWKEGDVWQQVSLDSGKHAKAGELRKKAVELLKRVYGSVQPGHVVYLNFIRSNDFAGRSVEPWTRVKIGYRHGDLDGFDMILLNAAWYRVLQVN